MKATLSFIMSNWELISAILVLVIDWYIGKNPNNPYNNILDLIEKIIKKNGSITPTDTTK